MQHYNEGLIRWKQHSPSKDAGINNIQMPDKPTLIVWQTRDHQPTDYEVSLANHLIEAFSSGAETLEAVVSALNAQGMLHSDGTAFTTASFEQEMARLGH
ncbi:MULTISPECIES: recombinase-like helix-turn-helix domain-containing protein [unclassified Psychrobacter]|uniref:recombinase-like helix-turn-helix domain-containing protein n=1 Tax=unclassified Psychrobacter TaxID=196806 RepID=UPI0018F7A3FA|nr:MULTISPECIES: recombinase-like helix-turn-helix domain-containing protein [unclassified Psychrobacter]